MTTEAYSEGIMRHVVGLGLLIFLLSACGDEADKIKKEVDKIKSDIKEQVVPGAPVAPTGLTAAGGDAVVLLNWDVVADAISYKVLRAETAGGPYEDFSPALTNSYEDTAVANGTTYYYVVQAVNAAGASANSNEASATPLAQGNTLLPPAAPADLKATVSSASEIKLAWSDKSSTEDGFKVERKVGPGGSYSVIATLAAGATAYSNTGLSPSTQYFYRVFAFNAAGNSAMSNDANATTSAGAVQKPSYAANVHPLLMASCSGCHSAASFTRLKLTGSAGVDYGTVKGLVNTSSPASSILLTKASGSVGHAGGASFAVGSPSYNTILGWIEGGVAP